MSAARARTCGPRRSQSVLPSLSSSTNGRLGPLLDWHAETNINGQVDCRRPPSSAGYNYDSTSIGRTFDCLFKDGQVHSDVAAVTLTYNCLSRPQCSSPHTRVGVWSWRSTTNSRRAVESQSNRSCNQRLTDYGLAHDRPSRHLSADFINTANQSPASAADQIAAAPPSRYAILQMFNLLDT